MYKIAVIIVCGAAFGLLILQTAQNCGISFTAAEKAAIKAAVSNAVQRVARFCKKVLGNGKKDRSRYNS